MPHTQCSASRAIRLHQNWIGVLDRGIWYSRLADSYRGWLLAAAHERTLSNGSCLFRKGDNANGIYAVVKGGIEIRSNVQTSNYEFKEAVLTVIEPGGWFGEIAFLDGKGRLHDAYSDRETVLLHISKAALSEIISEQPSFYLELGRLMSYKHRLLYQLYEEALHVRAKDRVALRLMYLLEERGLNPVPGAGLGMRPLRISQDKLAASLGMSRQTVYMCLKELKDRGIIRMQNQLIEILQPESLRRVEGYSPSSNSNPEDKAI